MSLLLLMVHALIVMIDNSAIPASALDEDEDEDEDDTGGDSRDDERSGTRYNVSLYALQYARILISRPCIVHLVPRHLRHRGDVCGHASHRLVSPVTFLLFFSFC